MRAEDLIKAANKEGKFIFDKLEGIAHNQWGNSVFNVVDLMETMYILDNKYLSLHIPCIRTEKFSREQEGSEGSMDILMGGYGIFEGDKLVEHIDSKMGRGLNWLMNKINSGTIVVKSPEDHNITLEIIEASTKIKPKITNGKLSVNVLIRMSSNFNEITYPENIFTEDKLLYFKNQQEELIKEEVMSVINFAQEKKMDFFGTADAVNHKYPIKWEDIYMAEWKENFSQLDFNVSVKSRINRTYDIKEPTRSKAGE
jgi:spore germination protein KC